MIGTSSPETTKALKAIIRMGFPKKAFLHRKAKNQRKKGQGGKCRGNNC